LLADRRDCDRPIVRLHDHSGKVYLSIVSSLTISSAWVSRLMSVTISESQPVVDERGCCAGIVAQADVVWTGNEHEVSQLLREVSRDTGEESR
jgi:CBS-domain-containing membrane protein